MLSLKEVSKQTPGLVGGTGNCVTNCKQDFMMWPFSLLVCTSISFPLNIPLLKSHKLWYVSVWSSQDISFVSFLFILW